MTLWRKVWRRILLWGGVTSLFGCDNGLLRVATIDTVVRDGSGYTYAVDSASNWCTISKTPDEVKAGDRLLCNWQPSENP